MFRHTGTEQESYPPFPIGMHPGVPQHMISAFLDLFFENSYEHIFSQGCIRNRFTTTADFLEGAGSKHPAGTNVVIVAVTEGEGENQTVSYKCDVLAGFVDLSGYASTEAVDAAKTEAITQANSDTDEKLTGHVRASDIEEITEEEILALFAKE